MAKRNIVILIIIIVVLLVAIGLVFYFLWQGGPELRTLNKNLPEGIRVEEKNDQQVLINKIDNYELKIPKEWGGLKKVTYSSEEELGIGVEAKNTNDWISISKYKNSSQDETINWVERRIEQVKGIRFYRPTILDEEKIGNYRVIKVKDESPSGITYFYYFQTEFTVYEIYSDYSEKSIKDIILNGKF